MLNHLRSFALVLAALLAACGGGGDANTPSAGPNLTTEPDRAVTATIGTQGGTLSATSSAGVVYTLTVPPLALAEPRAITLTPVAAIRGLALAGGMAAAVDLQPSGLVFDLPATLTIAAATAAPAGQLAIALEYEGDATRFTPTLARRSAGTWTLLVSHFSGAAVGFGTTQELSRLVSSVNAGGSAAFIAQLVAAWSAPTRDARAELAVFVAWFQTVLLPQIQGAATDAELHRAVSQQQHWSELISMTGTCDLLSGSPSCAEVLDPLHEAARLALAPQLRSAIFGNNEVCAAQQSLSALMNVLFWQGLATHFGIDTAQHGLDLPTVLAGLCARPVLESFALDEPLSAGFPYSLDLHLALRFGQNAQGQQVPFQVDLAASNATLQNPSGFTNAQGLYTTVITASGNGPLEVTGKACLVAPGTTQVTPVCGNVAVQRRALDLTGVWSGQFYDRRVNPNGSVVEFTGPVTVTLNQNQNAISGSYAVPNGSSGGVTATLSGGQLFNYTLSQSAPCGGTYVGLATVSADGNTITANVSGSTCLGTHTGSSTVTRQGP
ncbi:MAG: hypothetical protein IT503_20555 [Burkholderiaceae bacterium]|nr:MAG: hypothetical protein F9K36_13825 [Burkholderiaceae bacterium]MBE7425965.1 hypothetical protein [Ideonella sp.]MCC7288573.1 hypothetical protein [Burkholderiaceae bacterium]